MRIYAVADIHGRRERIETIRKTERELHPDVLVVAGDITGNASDHETLRQLNASSVPVLIIPGNMDAFADDGESSISSYERIFSIHLREYTIDGIPFCGVGGGLTFPVLEYFVPKQTPAMAATAFSIGPETVMVTHCPPYGVLDRGFGGMHAGSKALAQLVREKGPRLLICGHVHENPGVTPMGKTMVVNCSMGKNGAGALIEIDIHDKVRTKLIR